MFRTPFRHGLLLAAFACCLLAAAPAAGGATPQPGVRVGTAPQVPAGTTAEGALNAGRTLRLTIGLEPRDPEALAEFATAVSTPGAPGFRQFVGVDEFAHLFGPTEAQVEAVRASLETQGLEVGPTPANRMTLPVTGTVAEVESAFATSLEKVELPSERVAYVNDRPPALAASAAPFVTAVLGLDDLTSFHRSDSLEPAEGHVVTGGPQPCLTAQKLRAAFGGRGWTADQIATAYGFSSLYKVGQLGAGQTIGLLELQPYQPSDIATFQSCYGTSTPITNVDIAGGVGPYAGVDGESALDIEQVISLAPGAAVRVYQAPNNGLGTVEVLSAMTSENIAKSLSTSWGLCEHTAANYRSLYKVENNLLQEAAAQGQSFFAASGDDGSEDCGTAALAVDDPASQPFATGVGGTSLTKTEPATESLWNEGKGASGGGVSSIWSMPAYQSTAAASLGVVNANSTGATCGATLCRQVPDVAADAAPSTGYFVFSEGKWQLAGGTSAASPLWAAAIALANTGPACATRPVGFVNPAIYQLGGSAYATNFHDITAASPQGFATNDISSSHLLPYPVGPGYDMTTGVGTPVVGNLAASLCGLAGPAFSVTVANPGPQGGQVGTPASLQIVGAQSAAAPLVFSASGLPAGLAINAETGAITGTPTAAGVATVNVTVADHFGDVATTQFSWTIAAKPVPKVRAHLLGLAKRKPKLVFTVESKSGAQLRTLRLKLPPGLAANRSAHIVSRGVMLVGSTDQVIGTKSTPAWQGLKIRLGRPTTAAQVTIRFPALLASVDLVAKARRHKLGDLSLAVTAVEAPGGSGMTMLPLEPH